MLREKVATSSFAKEKNFRWRGGEVLRVEGFSDNVFGFALTLLVVSLEVPRTFSEMEETFRGFLAFAIAFLILFSFWYFHYQYFRRYGLEDTTVIWLNAALLFVVLFFVYPLKFLFSFVVKQLMRQSTDVLMPNGSLIPAISVEQWPTLMTAYGIGFILIYGIFVLLYVHAYKKRTELELTPSEIVLTRSSIVSHSANCAIGFLSILIIQIFGVAASFYSGMIYVLIGPMQGVIGSYYGKKATKAAGN